MELDKAIASLKSLPSHAVKAAAEGIYGTATVYLELRPQPAASERTCREVAETLSGDERDALHNKVWELAKLGDPRVHGERWGEHHAFDDLHRLGAAMRRLGLLTGEGMYRVQYMPFRFGEGGLGAQYFSLAERMGQDPSTGWIG
jgi:hypothetical protein